MGFSRLNTAVYNSAVTLRCLQSVTNVTNVTHFRVRVVYFLRKRHSEWSERYNSEQSDVTFLSELNQNLNPTPAFIVLTGGQ